MVNSLIIVWINRFTALIVDEFTFEIFIEFFDIAIQIILFPRERIRIKSDKAHQQ